MKPSRSALRCKDRALPEIRFESHQLTSFSGLVILQSFFQRCNLMARLQRACRGLHQGSYSFAKTFQLLITHLLLGFRRLRDADTYRHDPLVKRCLGLHSLPTVSTLSRQLARVDVACVNRLHEENRAMVLEALAPHGLARFTLDFDGSVVSTRRHAEGTAVGFNKLRKGQRSYYPLLCTVAQSGQAFDFLHRPGNVHDSNGAGAFMGSCLGAFSSAFPEATLETRSDSAFFNEQLIDVQEQLGAEFSISVPFERFVELKAIIEGQADWTRVNEQLSCSELTWRPKCWERGGVRLIAVRTRRKVQTKGALQLDLFEPVDFEHEYSVIATNKSVRADRVIAFHHGRGSQEGCIGELKEDMNLDYIPCRRRLANEAYMLAATYAHNLARQMQMLETAPRRQMAWKRPACWTFQKASSLRATLFRRAGRITRPHNRPTLTVSGGPDTARAFTAWLDRLAQAA